MRHDEVFERLEPPPGGLTRLRGRIHTRSRRRAPLLVVAFAVVAACVALLIVRRRGPDLVTLAHTHPDTSEIGLGLAPMPADPVALTAEQRTTTAMREVHTANSNVSFYWVSSIDWQE
jgi:hypothetical protein